MSYQHYVHETLGLEAEATPAGAESPGDGIEVAPHRHDDEESNDHLASLYEDRDEQFDTVAPFIRRGLQRGERCLYVADDNTREEVVAGLRERGVDVDGALAAGDLSIHTRADTYMRTGEFEREAMLEFWEETLAEARDEEGYEGVRAAAEMTWALDSDTPLDELAAYEAALNTIYPGEDYVVLCQYNRDRFPSGLVADVIRTHPLVVSGGVVCENFYYYPPEEFFAADRSTLDVDRMVEGLSSRARSRQALRERERYQRRLYEVTSSPALSTEEKLDALFDLGREYFDLELGGIARVDPETDLFEVERVSGDHDHLVPGASVALSETYCRLVAADGAGDGEVTAAVSDPVEDGFEGTAAYEEFGVNAYLGTRIALDDDLDRTFFFASTEPREESFSDAQRTFHRLMGQWLEHELERQRREDRLAALNRTSRALTDAETAAEIADVAVEHADERLRLPVAAVALYEAGDLSPAARTPRAADELPVDRLCRSDGGPAWEAFVAGETRLVEGPTGADGPAEVIVVPLGNHGVFVAGRAVPGRFSEAEREFVETAAATVEAALARADRERRLKEQERTLEEQNRRLERLNRINDTIRDIDQALVRASTREEIEGVVCERLVDAGPYEFAMVGERDVTTDGVTPREWADTGDAIDGRALADGSPLAEGPAERVVETREPLSVDDILDERSFESWRQAALDRGFHACIALPLVYEDTLYGILQVYAGRPGVFDELERAVLAELSDTVAYAINAVESKKALVSDEVKVLEFAIRDTGLGPVGLSREFDCEFVLESLVPRSDGDIGVFFSTHGVTAAEVRGFAPRLPVADLTLVSESDEDERVCLFAGTLEDGGLCGTILEHGGRPRSLTVADGTARVTVEVASDGATREFVETIRTRYPESELVAQRSHERPRRTPTEVRVALTEQLTDRQLEALKTAYFSGYFDQPRASTGSEIADTMGISQPTFHSHVRAAQQRLCEELFDVQHGE